MEPELEIQNVIKVISGRYGYGDEKISPSDKRLILA